MGRDHWRPERTRHSPWGAIALVMLSGLALMRNGPDLEPGPPPPGAAASAGGHPVAAWGTCGGRHGEAAGICPVRVRRRERLTSLP